MSKDFNEEANENRPKTVFTGVVLFIIGVLTAALMAFIIWKNAGNEEFFYITTTVNGISSREYNPAFVIGMLAFGFVFAIVFIILGLYMIKNRLASIQISIGADINIDTKTNKIEVTEYGNKSPSMLSGIFITIGMILFIICAAFFIWDRISIKSLVKTEASVVRIYKINYDAPAQLKISNSYYADIEYRAQGEKIQSRLTVSMFFKKTHVTIYYDPSNPLICRRNGEYIFIYVILLAGFWGFTFVGGILRLLRKRR